MKLEKDIICSFYPLLLDEYSKNAKGKIYFLTLFAYFNHSEMANKSWITNKADINDCVSYFVPKKNHSIL